MKEWNGMEGKGREWHGREGKGMKWKGREWNGMEWNAMQCNEMNWNEMNSNPVQPIPIQSNPVQSSRQASNQLINSVQFIQLNSTLLRSPAVGPAKGSLAAQSPSRNESARKQGWMKSALDAAGEVPEVNFARWAAAAKPNECLKPARR